jgi:hypothetical protein
VILCKIIIRPRVHPKGAVTDDCHETLSRK